MRRVLLALMLGLFLLGLAGCGGSTAPEPDREAEKKARSRLKLPDKE